MPSDECRRRRSWKISKYSKIAFASSTRVFHRGRSRRSSFMRATPVRFDHRVVVAVANGSHRGQQTGVDGPLGERRGRELRPLITVDNGRPVRRSTLLDGYAQCIRHQCCCGIAIDGPAHDAPAERVEDDGAVHLVLSRRMFGDIGDHRRSRPSCPNCCCTRSYAVATLGTRLCRGRPENPCKFARRISLYAACRRTEIPYLSVSSAWTRLTPYVPRDSECAGPIGSVNHA